jgi:hypothetical protein
LFGSPKQQWGRRLFQNEEAEIVVRELLQTQECDFYSDEIFLTYQDGTNAPDFVEK